MIPKCRRHQLALQGCSAQYIPPVFKTLTDGKILEPERHFSLHFNLGQLLQSFPVGGRTIARPMVENLPYDHIDSLHFQQHALILPYQCCIQQSTACFEGEALRQTLTQSTVLRFPYITRANDGLFLIGYWKTGPCASLSILLAARNFRGRQA